MFVRLAVVLAALLAVTLAAPANEGQDLYTEKQQEEQYAQAADLSEASGAPGPGAERQDLIQSAEAAQDDKGEETGDLKSEASYWGGWGGGYYKPRYYSGWGGYYRPRYYYASPYYSWGGYGRSSSWGGGWGHGWSGYWG